MTKRIVAELPRISVNRADAAKILGVSVDMLKEHQRLGRLRAKNTKFDPETGEPIGITLYDIAELRAWFDGLGDA